MQLVVLVSMLPTVPGMIVLVDYSNDEMRPMVATALPALDWFSGRPAPASLIHALDNDTACLPTLHAVDYA